MPAKTTNIKNSNTKETKTTKPTKKADTTEKKETVVEETHKKEILDDSDNELDDDNGNTNSKKKGVRKAGRTLLVSPSNGSSVSESTFKDLSGLSSSFSTKNGAYFLVFDTIQNSLDNFRKLRSDKPELKVKFCRYQAFFTITGLTDSSDYTATKQEISTYVEKKTGGNVLYFKLYRNGDKYRGCGDLTLDTKDALDKLLDKEGELKNYTVGSLSGTFYRYNKDNKKQSDGNKVYSS
jgi:hypothetical protein